MGIRKLGHYSIRTTDLQASRTFYTEILGLREGFRPPFNFPGIWLYQGGDEADFGYNAESDTLEFLFEAGIIDPTKVVRATLVNAASVAALMLTTEALVSEIREKVEEQRK